MKKIKNKLTTDNMITAVFMVVTICILSLVIFGDDHDVAGYYQNLIIASFSMALVIMDISKEIQSNKDNEKFLPTWLDRVYISCRVFIIICCAWPIVVYVMASQVTLIGNHLHQNCGWWSCIPTFLFSCYLVFWGYLYPIFVPFSYKSRNIKFEQRNSLEEEIR